MSLTQGLVDTTLNGTAVAGHGDESLMEDCIEAMEELLVFVRSVGDLCLHIVTEASEPNMDNESEKTLQRYNYTGMSTVHLKKLPFVLLDDVVDCLPIHHLQLFWKFGPSQWLYQWCGDNGRGRADTATDADATQQNFLFSQHSSLLLIRLCNKVLRKLSVDLQHHHQNIEHLSNHPDTPYFDDTAAAFAGQISLILASIFPLSERSAVNILGAFHTDHTIRFETLEEYKAQQQLQQEQNDDANDVKRQVVSLNYDFYSSFWSIQQCFIDPSTLVPSIVSQSGAAPKMQWSTQLEKFLVRVQLVLGSFETYAFSDELVHCSKARYVMLSSFAVVLLCIIVT